MVLLAIIVLLAVVDVSATAVETVVVVVAGSFLGLFDSKSQASASLRNSEKNYIELY